jgi:glutamate/tyrosine decarboxylase-like PLP-dependent enzyme
MSLAMDPEEMRRLGYRTIDALVDELVDRDAPVVRRATAAELERRLAGPPPEEPEGFELQLERLRDDVLPFMARSFHPGFFAFVPSSGTWPGALGDLIASALNVHAGAWLVGAGPSRLEVTVIDWFKDWLGLPASAGGTLVSGGSVANMTALACARERMVGAMRDDLVVYVADQAHSSVPRAARVLGFRPEQVRVLPVDAGFRLAPRTLKAALDADVRAGRRPLLVSASGGATSTGAVDPLREIAAICSEHGAWMHVDAAYGGFAVLTERGRAALDGISLADSVTLDPHKWLYQPYECGCVLVRDGRALPAAFAMTPDYLRDARALAGEVNFADHGLQLTRTARAFKLWLSIRTLGLRAFRDAVDRALDLAATAAEWIERSPELELMAPPSLGIVCFRRLADERANAELVAALEAAGFALVSSTRLRGRYAIRMCVLNHTTRAVDVERTLDFLATHEVAGAPVETTEYPLHADAGQTWPAALPAGPRPDWHALVELPLFASLSPGEAEAAASLAELRDAEASETIVRQWEVSRDFFVLLDGAVEVLVDDRRVRELHRGDMFGEIAALEWAHGYGYPRTASVVASEATRLVVFPDGALNELVRRLPVVGRRVRATMHDRLSDDAG